MRRFENQVVVITGSATGIGAATARRFAAEGAWVACLDINDADNEATAAAARAAGVEALALPCDVRSRADQHGAFEIVTQAWGAHRRARRLRRRLRRRAPGRDPSRPVGGHRGRQPDRGPRLQQPGPRR